MNAWNELGRSVKGDIRHLCAGVWKREGERMGARGGGGVRNAPRLRTMPSPITYTSSWIACPALVAASLPPHLFLLTVFLQCFTDPTDYFNILTTRNKNYNWSPCLISIMSVPTAKIYNKKRNVCNLKNICVAFVGTCVPLCLILTTFESSIFLLFRWKYTESLVKYEICKC